MPIYLYECDSCKQYFEYSQGMNDLPLGICECGQQSRKRIPQLFNVIDASPHTLGSLAELNNKRLGEKRYEEIRKIKEQTNKRWEGQLPEGAKTIEKDRDYIPPWRDGPIDTSLSSLAPEIGKTLTPAAEKFIMTGKK